jgi:hypothetical protein
MNLHMNPFSKLSVRSLLASAALAVVPAAASLAAAAHASASGKSASVANITDISTSGVIVGTSGNSVHVLLPSGSRLSATLPGAAMTYMDNQGQINPCEVVTMDYHQGSAGAVLDRFTPTAITTSPDVAVIGGGTCANQGDGALDVVGKIMQISKTGVTINVPGLGKHRFPLDPNSLVGGGNQPGDMVDLTFERSAPHMGVNIQTTEAFLSGTVTRVNSTKLTVRDPVSGHRTTFALGLGGFRHIARGHRVGVLYWVNAGVPQADSVTDFSSGVTN